MTNDGPKTTNDERGSTMHATDTIIPPETLSALLDVSRVIAGTAPTSEQLRAAYLSLTERQRAVWFRARGVELRRYARRGEDCHVRSFSGAVVVVGFGDDGQGTLDVYIDDDVATPLECDTPEEWEELAERLTAWNVADAPRDHWSAAFGR